MSSLYFGRFLEGYWLIELAGFISFFIKVSINYCTKLIREKREKLAQNVEYYAKSDNSD